MSLKFNQNQIFRGPDEDFVPLRTFSKGGTNGLEVFFSNISDEYLDYEKRLRGSNVSIFIIIIFLNFTFSKKNNYYLKSFST